MQKYYHRRLSNEMKAQAEDRILSTASIGTRPHLLSRSLPALM